MGYRYFLLQSQSPRCCFSTEEYNERQNNHPMTIEKKVISEWFYRTFCVDCKKNRVYKKRLSISTHS